MSDCTDTDAYLNRRLSKDEADAYRAHMEQCDSCKAALAKWQQVRENLAEMFEQDIPAPDLVNAKRLIKAADSHIAHSIPLWQRPAVWAGVAMAASLLLIALVWLPGQSEPAFVADDKADQPASSPVKPVSTEQQSAPVTADPVKRIEATEDNPLQERIGRTLMGIAANAALEVTTSNDDETRLRLLRGKVGFEVTPRIGQEQVSIEVDAYTVSVVGTRFWVERLPDRTAGANELATITVGVTRGIVSISTSSTEAMEPIRLTSGQKVVLSSAPSSLEIEQLNQAEAEMLEELLAAPSEHTSADSHRIDLRSPSPEAVYNEANIRKWIIEGAHERAGAALRRRVATTPTDMSAMDLLATCHRKSGNYKEAMRAYEMIRSRGTLAQASRAGYRAASIAQDHLGDHQTAIALLEQYLTRPVVQRPNTLEARIRLGRSLKATGSLSRYRELLRIIVSEHGGTEAAIRAKAELDALN